MAVRSFRDLVAWQKAMDLADNVFAVSERWPREQLFILTAQVQRSALSVPSNIAEGQGRGGRIEFLRFLDIAFGSLCELGTQLELAGRRRFVDQQTLHALLEQIAEVGRLIHGLMRCLRSASAAGEHRATPPTTNDEPLTTAFRPYIC